MQKLFKASHSDAKGVHEHQLFSNFKYTEYNKHRQEIKSLDHSNFPLSLIITGVLL